MPNRKKFNARFPPARIKKIMRTDKEVGKVAAPVPAVISRALELFAEQLLQKAGDVTVSRGSRTLSPAHLKHCILSERRFDFLKELVEGIPDAAESEEAGGSSAPPAPAAATSAARSAEPPPPPPARSAVSDGPRSAGRPPKYLKMEMPTSTISSTNGQPHSAPPGRPPVPGLIHTSLLGLTGGAVTASAVGGERFTFGAPLTAPLSAPLSAPLTAPLSAPLSAPLTLPAALYGAPSPTPPPAHRGSVRPPLAVRYGSLPDGDRPDAV